jgi:RNA polymerase sporulation-specific sigma factor
MTMSETLFEDHLFLAQVISLEYLNISRVTSDESLSEAQQALWRAATAYNPSRGEFAPYAARAIRNALNTLYAKQLKLLAIFPISIDGVPNWSGIASGYQESSKEPAFVIQDQGSGVRKNVQLQESSALIDQVMKKLSLREQVVVQAIKEGHSFSEIGEKLSISKQAAHQLGAKALTKLRAALEELGFQGLDTEGFLKSQKQVGAS